MDHISKKVRIERLQSSINIVRKELQDFITQKEAEERNIRHRLLTLEKEIVSVKESK